jgi:ABC-type oligopeptide transport system ATPase subunit
MVDAAPLLDVKNIVVSFPAGRTGSARAKAVDGVSFVIPRGAVAGLVGESGCGKTTLGRTIARFQPSDSGAVLLDGVDLAGLPRKELGKQRRRIQMIFQNPFASLDPRMTVADAIAEAFLPGRANSRGERTDAIIAALAQVGLDSGMLGKFPHEFSGGQRQRIAIARALVIR